MPSSPHPKLSAIIGAMIVIGAAVQSLIDGNPATNPDWSTVGASLFLCYGLFTARQNNTSSEDVGLKK